MPQSPDIDEDNVQRMLDFLVLPDEPDDDAEDAAEINAQIETIQDLDDRLAGLFEETKSIRDCDSRELKSHLTDWIISEKGLEEFNSAVYKDQDQFLEWLKEQVNAWETGESLPQPNPNGVEGTWQAFYRYDPVSQEYYYSKTIEISNPDDWGTWEEWEAEEPLEATDVQETPVAAEAEPVAPAVEAASFTTTEEALEGAALVTDLVQATLNQSVAALPDAVVAVLSPQELENLAVEANKAVAQQG